MVLEWNLVDSVGPGFPVNPQMGLKLKAYPVTGEYGPGRPYNPEGQYSGTLAWRGLELFA